MVTPLVYVFWLFSERYRSKYISAFFVLVFNMVLLASFPQRMKISYLYITFCLALYGYGIRITGDHVFAACYAVLSAHFGGWLYEVPFWHPSEMFYSFYYPFLANPQILSGLFCVWLLLKREIRVNKIMLWAALGYVAVSLFYILPSHPQWMNTSWWLPRGLTMLLLWAILTGIKGENKKMNFAEEESV